MVIIISGIAIGLWLSLSEGTFFILACALIIFFILKYALPQEDRGFVFKVILIGFALRIIMALLYYYLYLAPGNIDILGPDGESYSQRGWYISRLLLGQDPHIVPASKEYIFQNYNDIVQYYKGKLPAMGVYQIGIFTYLFGLLYAAYNYSPLMIRIINSSLSILTAIIVYFIAREIFNARVGRISLAILMFLPSSLLFSVTAIKDPAIIFLLTLIIWLMLKFQAKKNILFIILVFASALLTNALRLRMMIPLLFFIAFSFWAGLKLANFKKIVIALAVVFLLMSIPQLTNQVKYSLIPENFFSAHIGYINTGGGSTYKIFPERCYLLSQSRLTGVGPLEIAQGVLEGTMHLFYEPLPYRIFQSKGYFFAFFQTALLCLFTPFIIMGLLMALRYQARKVIPLTAFLVIFTPLLALTEGSVGTVIRHRDMLIPFLIILGVAGAYVKFAKDDKLFNIK